MRQLLMVVLGASIVLSGWAQDRVRAQDDNKDEPKATPPKDASIEGRSVKEWLDDLEGKDRKQAYKAAAVLAKAGAKAVEAAPTLEKIQKDDSDPYKQSLASYVLAYIRPDETSKATPQDLLLILKTKENSPTQRSVAAAQLAKLGPGVSDAIFGEVVFLLKNDRDPYTRALSAYALPYLRPKTVDAVRPLVEALHDKSRGVARTAAASVVVLGDKARSGAPLVMPLLDDKDAYKRALGAYVLGNISPDRTQAVPALMKLMSDKNDNVAKAAREAIKKIDPDRAKREGIN